MSRIIGFKYLQLEPSLKNLSYREWEDYLDILDTIMNVLMEGNKPVFNERLDNIIKIQKAKIRGFILDTKGEQYEGLLQVTGFAFYKVLNKLNGVDIDLKTEIENLFSKPIPCISEIWYSIYRDDIDGIYHQLTSHL